MKIRYPPSGRKGGFTLLELVIASLMMAVLMGAAVALDFANNQMYVASVADRELLEEIHLALARIQQDVREGYTVIVQNDTAPHTIRISNSGETVWVRYQWDDAADQLWYYPDESSAVYEIIASRISGFSIDYPTPVGGEIAYFTVLIKAKGSWGTILTKEIPVRVNIGSRLFKGVTLQVT